jgi:alpha-tubulin suppressor-like RCC1 family protein
VHTCGRRTTGRLYCWGDGTNGVLGEATNSTVDRPTPVLVAGGATPWGTVDAGGDFTCARRSSGRLYCWGSGFWGQLGDGSSGGAAMAFTPRPVHGGATDWTAVSAGGVHACARVSTGRLNCWGRGATGAVGDGTTTDARTTPTDVAA